MNVFLLMKGIILLLLLSKTGICQTSTKGIELGYGNSYITNSSGWSLYPNEITNFLTLGYKQVYSPERAYFNTSFGLTFDRRWVDHSTFNYFRIPLGIDIKLGRKVEYFLGAGLYLSYLFMFQIPEDYRVHIQDLKRFQAGWYPNAGLRFRMNDKGLFTLSVKYNMDIIKTYERKGSSLGGSPYSIYDKGQDLYVLMGFCFDLNNKERNEQ